jgi:hypothetical protein
MENHQTTVLMTTDTTRTQISAIHAANMIATANTTPRTAQACAVLRLADTARPDCGACAVPMLRWGRWQHKGVWRARYRCPVCGATVSGAKGRGW